MKHLILMTTILAFCVVVLGAYVRLSGAGLGCPDWPGCYGHFAVPQQNQIGKGILPYAPTNSDSPLETDKAWKEMAHRYLAGTLTLLILLIAFLSRKKILPWLIVATVIFQALLGMLTVTMKLNPWIVLCHLMGGMTTLGLLWWMTLSCRGNPCDRRKSLWDDRPGRIQDSPLRKTALLGLIILMIQIALGGWVSSNYAFLACPDFPTCLGHWWPSSDFSNPMTIHMMHRAGALVTFIYLGILSLKGIFKGTTSIRRNSFLLLILLILQIGLGIANVLLVHPLPIAVMHNAVAALLLLTLITINHMST